ncbi:hypothetical protein GCM10011317_50170 [Niveispirillum cyanobacteriorum]|uniref:HipA domain-containing protein n=1 Tax=Niveispirillum cyanobacteriorum TaxID=1612173 RepID=UPI001990B06D|nr:HipA domain-containing protein [Niveispirillum cyanobacteriorum]GGE87032.1 hypothetical protein GCM10011317_50170 [Niveispirillum cyanobacteriorum]
MLFWLIGATDCHTKNFSIALTPGGRFTMTPLYDVLTVQPGLDAGHIQSKQMTLAMRVGKNRHYRVGDIFGCHFLETGLAAGLSRSQVETVFQEVANIREVAFVEACARMPQDFPDSLAASVKKGFEQRLARTELPRPDT